MAISDTVQTLSAAFSFGILLQAATGALFVYWGSHGASIFQDGRRLVLILFLIFAALWAQIDFVNLLIPTTQSASCQGLLGVTTALDQLARVAMEQFLLWSVGQGTKLTAERLILQVVLLIRLVAGGILVGMTRPQFAPLCLARTSLLPVGIVVLALDAVIIIVLLIRALLLGNFGDNGFKQRQSKALICAITGLAVWTGTSVPMILGITTIILILRTVLPANGLLVLVGIVAIFPEALLMERREETTTPESSSPFMAPMPPSREILRGDVGADGSPVVYNKGSNLFVVNPSFPHSPTTRSQANTGRNSRGFTKLGEEITIQEMHKEGPHRPERPEVQDTPGYRGSSGTFSTFIMPSSGTQGALASQSRSAISVNTSNISGPMNLDSTTPQKRGGLFGWSKSPAKPSIRSLGISQPTPINSTQQQQTRIQTIDLATAVNNERERREGAAMRARLAASREAAAPLPFSTQEGLRKSISTKRKNPPTISAPGEAMAYLSATVGSTTSASLSPGREEVRRRSPRSQDKEFNAFLNEKAAPLPTLETKQTIGLPSHPRSSRMPRPPTMDTESTVMLVNNIVYNDPGMVKNIISGAPQMYSSSKKHRMNEKSAFSISSTTDSVKSSGSIIHRPRPIKRQNDQDRQLFPSDPSPRTIRPKSSGSIISRKLVLMSNPGSPSALPPLPLIPPMTPRKAADLTRLLPNNTKSMNLDEKIQLLFPAPPNLKMHNRRSSVPSLPRVPSVFIADTPPTQSPTEEEQQSRRASKRTTIASFGLDDLHVEGKVPDQLAERETYRFSANTYRNIADDAEEASLPIIPAHDSRAHDSRLEVPDRQLVFEDLRKSSKLPSLEISKAMQTAQATYIERSGTSRKDHVVGSQIDDDGKEVMTVMLDSEEARRSLILTANDNNRRSFLLDVGEEMPEDRMQMPEKHGSWHHRIGDELPTFSERSTHRSRKMPPPTPLLLNRAVQQTKIVIRNTEPSPPVDSPGQALKEIQAQLKNFEESSRGSVGSILRNLPGAASDDKSSEKNNRLRLLENLEAEMGQQETNWQQMQKDLDRDSLSLIMTPQKPLPETPSESDLSRESSQRSNRSLPATRQARIRSSIADQLKGEDTSRSNSTQSSENSRASVWQQRLAEAQMEYLENAPELLRKKSLNFLNVSKLQQLGSPTPPESVESESEVETEFDSETEDLMNPQVSVEVRKEMPSLWQLPASSPKAAVGRMWNAPYESSVAPTASSEPPAKNVRPAQRRAMMTLPLLTSELWTKPTTPEHSRPVVGLWGSRPVRPRSIVTRRVTQRPPRRLRRVTFLPDIVESPQPIPNNRQTLGIFQFPWGETSDQPVYQPRFDPTLLAGPALNVDLDARARELESSEYETSFFDDYEEEDSDDDFDESTLFEIANLLNSEDVPSRLSLLPSKIIEDYDASDSEEQEVTATAPKVNLPIQPLAVLTREDPVAVSRRSSLWAKDDASTTVDSNGSLLQPETSVWDALIPSSDDIVRSKSRAPAAMPSLTTNNLWAISEPEVSEKAASALWARKEATRDSHALSMSSRVYTRSPPEVSSFLWSVSTARPQKCDTGLFSVPSDGIVVRTTEASPAALAVVKTPRRSSNAIPVISSTNLWVPDMSSKDSKIWIECASSSTKPTPISTSMWSPVVKRAAIIVEGLFNSSETRDAYRSSSFSPAALSIVRKPRTSEVPLDQLVSTELWRGCEKQAIEHHWISESSVRPESPIGYSTTSSGNSSPVSDSSSIKSTSTKASSIYPTMANGEALKTQIWWDSKKLKKSPSSSPILDEQQASKVPVRKQSFKGLAPVRESRVLSFRDLLEANLNASALDSTPVKRLRKETVVSKPAKATAQMPSMQRVNATPAMWDSALTEAIALSRLRVQRINATPDMWDAALIEATSKTTPRTDGEQRYNAAVLHPVFFTQSLVSNAKDIHPAAIGHVTQKSGNAAMWSAASAKPSPQASWMWSNTPVVQHSTATVTKLAGDALQRQPVTRSLELPVLESSQFWRPTPVVANARNWLSAMKPQSDMWRILSIDKPLESGPMWVKETATRHSTVILSGDAPLRAPIIRNIELAALESNELWQPTQQFSSECNWLSISASATISELAVPSQPRLHRINATREIWEGALAEAMLLSQAAAISGPALLSEPALNISAGPVSPVLESKETKSHSTEHEWLSSKSSISSKPTMSTKLMWSAPSTTTAFVSGELWTKNQTISHSSAPVVKLSGEPPRRVFVSRSLDVPTLESKNFWHPAEKVSTERNWIKTSTVNSARTWIAPSASKATLASGSNCMWKAGSQDIPTPASIFPDLNEEPWNRKKRDVPEGVDELQSTELWRASMTMSESPKNWLVERRFSRVEFRY